MGIFDDDPFEEVIRGFFGNAPVRRRNREEFIQGEEEDRHIDYVEDDKNIFLIFEIPGYNKEDISLDLDKKDLQIIAKKTDEDSRPYLIKKLLSGLVINKKLPKDLNTKNFSYVVNNGVLEIKFKKK
jgi:HSP20 family molecular chaperone IbpA